MIPTVESSSILPRTPLITTIPERCRVCFTCVRECPAKAIRITGGQAAVIQERCIGCGNCVRVCNRGAKQVRSSVDQVEELLECGAPTAALVAPSFAAEIGDLPYTRFVGALKALGFDLVNEVAFGADLVAARYRELLQRTDDRRYVATSCPALVSFVEKYHPECVPNLAPVVSPMVAIARVLRELHGKNLKVVFIGPCIAKKAEAREAGLPRDVDEVLTFRELNYLFLKQGIDLETATPAQFDPPEAGLGELFPLSRGMLQAADIKEDLLTAKVVSADGRTEFVAALKDFESGAIDARLLDVLACNGCIMGTGMTSKEPLFRRRSRVSSYVRHRFGQLNLNLWHAKMGRFSHLNLEREFSVDDQRVPPPSLTEVEAILARMGKLSREDELNCGACGYDTCREHAIAIHKGLAESEMCLPYAIDRLDSAFKALAESHEELASTQQALMQSERLASMGQLAAGIAHEINNPLGVVLLYGHNLLEEMRESAIQQDLVMIVEQADRCKKIVSGLLNFARRNKVLRQTVEIPRLVEHCLKVLTIPANVNVSTVHAEQNLRAEIDADQISQVLTNLISNALAAMPDGGQLQVRTGLEGESVVMEVEDSGIGIPEENIHKIFEPFFTTKQIGMGVGLGLAVSYGIIKMHRGSIVVRSNADPAAGPRGTTFKVRLPSHAPLEPEEGLPVVDPPPKEDDGNPARTRCGR